MASSNDPPRRLPDRTSRYNVGGVLPRIRDRRRRTDFELRRPTAVFDGGGRQIGVSEGPVKLNAGAVRRMDLGEINQSGRASHSWRQSFCFTVVLAIFRFSSEDNHLTSSPRRQRRERWMSSGAGARAVDLLALANPKAEAEPRCHSSHTFSEHAQVLPPILVAGR